MARADRRKDAGGGARASPGSSWRGALLAHLPPARPRAAGRSPRSIPRTSCSPASRGCASCRASLGLVGLAPARPRRGRSLPPAHAAARGARRERGRRSPGGDLDAPLPPRRVARRGGGARRARSTTCATRSRSTSATWGRRRRRRSASRASSGSPAASRPTCCPAPTAGGPGEGYELGATLVPARAVGGDLFDHFRDGSRVFFLVGDVSGKGIARRALHGAGEDGLRGRGLARSRPGGAARAR